MTPAEIALEIEAWRKREERLDYRTGLVCAVLANFFRDPKSMPEPFEPKDFMPSYARELREEEKPTAKKQKQRQTWQDMAEIIRMSAGNNLVKGV